MTSSAGRIASNTVIMYIRMLFLIIIAFYTSRLLLTTLGIEDFGILSVVGSVTSTFLSLKALFSESIQRFLNFEKGKQSLNGQRAVFSLGVFIHVCLAFVFIIVVGLIGHWLISNKLTIPPDKLNTAFFIFDMSMIAMFISILSIPFDAVVIANEKMKIYAFITIIDAILRLLSVVALSFVPYERLRTYSVLLIAIPLFTLSAQLIYCRRFVECKITKKIPHGLFKDLFSLSGWNFMGNISFSLVHEGINMLLNVFGGLVYNAARAISYQLKGVVSQITSNTIISARPRIMQQAAIADKTAIFNNIIAVSRVAFFTILLPVSILTTYTDKILGIWLVDVPEYATIFTRLLLIGVMIRSLHEPINMLQMAFGRIKRMMIIEAVTMLSFLVIIYITLKLGAEMWCPFAELALMEIIINALLITNAYKELSFPIMVYIKDVVLPFLITIILTGMICVIFFYFVPCYGTLDTIFKSMLVGVSYMLIALLLMNDKERHLIIDLVTNKIRIKNG